MILCTSEELKPFSSEMQNILKQEVIVQRINQLPDKYKKQVRIVVSYGNYGDVVSKEELHSLPKLQWVQAISSGVEQLPLEFMVKRGIVLTTVRGIHRIPISEYVLGVMLYFAKKVPTYEHFKQNKIWGNFESMDELYGKTVGILGTGQIGRAIAFKAKVFGMTTLGVNRSGRDVEYFDNTYGLSEWEHILPHCDYVCGVLPSTPETKQLINRRTIERMKDGLVLINVGRGDLIVEQDVIDALQSGKIAGAALDVFEQEPLDDQNPLWNLDNVFITPHASARTPMYIRRSLDIFYRNYELFQQGQYEQMMNRIS